MGVLTEGTKSISFVILSSLGPPDPGLDLNQSYCVISVLVHWSKRRVY